MVSFVQIKRLNVLFTGPDEDKENIRKDAQTSSYTSKYDCRADCGKLKLINCKSDDSDRWRSQCEYIIADVFKSNVRKIANECRPCFRKCE